MTPDEPATRTFLSRLRSEGWEAIPAHEPAMRGHRWFVEESRRVALEGVPLSLATDV